MKTNHLMIALAVTSLAACGGSGGSGSSVDLDAADGLWLASGNGKSLILHTYKGSGEVSLDVRASPHAATEGQYMGTRTGTADTAYTLTLDCLNPGTESCAAFGDATTLTCTPGTDTPQLLCGSLTFDQVTSADISQ